MNEHMKETERLIDRVASTAFSSALGEVPTTKLNEDRATLLAHIQRGAVPECDNGKRVLREVFALCEDTEVKCSDEPGDFARGRRFEAKGIARAIGAWYQEEFCGRSHMGEPATSAPDQFRDAAKMVAEPAEVPSQHAGARIGTEEGGEAYTIGYTDGEAAGYKCGLAEALRAASGVGKFVGAGDGETRVVGSSAEAVQAIKQLQRDALRGEEQL